MSIDLTSCIAFVLGFAVVYFLFKGLRLLVIAGLIASAAISGYCQSTANFLRVENNTTNVLELADLNGTWDSFIPPNTMTEYHDLPQALVDNMRDGDQMFLAVLGGETWIDLNSLSNEGWPLTSEIAGYVYLGPGDYFWNDCSMDNLDVHPNHENVWTSLSMGFGVGFLVCGIGVLVTMYFRMTGGAGF